MQNEIAAKLRTLRKGKKLTQQELAEKMKLSRATISNYEVGRRAPHLSELQRFAEFYGVDLSYFGIAAKDEIFDLLSRAKEVFANENISKEKKEELYKELLRLYLMIK